MSYERSEPPTVPHGPPRTWLDCLGVAYWSLTLAPGLDHIFVHDPGGNPIELHQTGTCGCQRSAR